MAEELPVPPWIYIHSVFPISPHFAGEASKELRKMLPEAVEHDVHSMRIPNTNTVYFSDVQYSPADIHKSIGEMVQQEIGKKTTASDGVVRLLVDKHSPPIMAKNIAKSLQHMATERGGNFVTVKLMEFNQQSRLATTSSKMSRNGNHISLDCTDLGAIDVALKVYRALFSVLSVKEQLLLHEWEALKPTRRDQSRFPGYTYCALSDVAKQSPSAKIFVIGLIETKPEVTRARRVAWRVVDRTGSKKYFFEWTGENSYETWDWVMTLQVGQRKVLPRKHQTDENGRSGSIRLLHMPARGLAKTYEGFSKALAIVAEATRAARKCSHQDVRKEKVSQWGNRKGSHLKSNIHRRMLTENLVVKEVDDVWEDDVSTVAGSFLEEKGKLLTNDTSYTA